MLSIFRPLIDRLKALFAVRAAQELEAELLLRDAECRAELLRRAERYAAEGLHPVAARLRQQAEGLSGERPLAAALPAAEHLAGEGRAAEACERPELLPAAAGDAPAEPAPRPLPAARKKGGRS